MSSISSLLSGFFHLPDQQAASTATDSNGTDNLSSLAQALAQADSQNSSGSSGNNNSSPFLLDLSPDAQKYLQNMGSTSNSSSTSSSAPSPIGSGFMLTEAQKQQITAILTKYKDAPDTQATATAIGNDLKAAGLSPEQLSTEDQIRQFNPVSVLVDALNGKVTSPTDLGTSQNESANAQSYIQSISAQWQLISSPNDTTSGGTDTTSVPAAGDTPTS